MPTRFEEATSVNRLLEGQRGPKIRPAAATPERPHVTGEPASNLVPKVPPSWHSALLGSAQAGSDQTPNRPSVFPRRTPVAEYLSTAPKRPFAAFANDGILC